MTGETYDAAILGGGLAGLCLGIQLEQANPGLKVLVADARARPAPEAAFKVGESTGLFSAAGMTLQEAEAAAPGLAHVCSARYALAIPV